MLFIKPDTNRLVSTVSWESLYGLTNTYMRISVKLIIVTWQLFMRDVT